MTTIKLRRDWELGGKFDEGGFGDIYEATADDGSPAVVKLIPKEPGAERELLFEDVSGLPNVLPILDSGEWKNSYVIVMPKAEKSLKKHVEENGGKLDIDQAIPVLTDMARALASLEAEVVHRDLKPGNILLFDGQWCLADFGIARYAEATTAPDTHKFSKTPAYAAPEQWRGERATNATDMYAFGVIAFELTQGQRPFAGPDYYEQHLNENAPAPQGLSAPMASLITECLLKAAAARPTAARILARLETMRNPTSPAAEKLQQANMAVNKKRSEAAARASAEQTRRKGRGELLDAARESLDRVVTELERSVLAHASAVEVERTGIKTVFRLGDGALVIDSVQSAPADCLAAFDYEPTFDVIGYSAIAAKKPRDRQYEGRAHSLWFCDAHEEGVYRWFELAFMVRPGMRGGYTVDPFALPPTDEMAGRCLTPVMDVRQLAWQPVAFDQGDEAQFIERWLNWLGEAADGSLSHPTHMPEDSGGHHRSARVRSRA